MLGARVLAVLGLLAVGVSGAAADTPPLGGLFHQSWGIRQGAPGTVVSITQTTDGYLWLAGPAGLYRFDGVEFERFIPSAGTLPRRIVRLLALPDGGLLLGSSDEGVVRLHGSQVFALAGHATLPRTLWDLEVDRSGVVWAGTSGGVFAHEGDDWRAVDIDGRSAREPTQAIHVSRDGTVWVGADAGLFRLDPLQRVFRATGIRRPVTGISQAPDGALWIFDGAELSLVAPDAESTSWTIPRIGSRNTVFAGNGALWSATTQGVGRVTFAAGRSGAASPPRVEVFGAQQGLSAANVFTVFEDREGNIWAGTGGGLDFFRETALTGSAVPPGTHAMRLAADPNGDLWIGSQNAPLLRLRAGVLSRHAVPAPVSSVVSDRQGGVWAWGAGALWHVDAGGRTTRMPPPTTAAASTWSMSLDREGRLWVSMLQSGVYRFEHGAWTRPALPDVAAASRVRLTYADDRGRIWLTVDDGLVIVAGETVRAVTSADGLQAGRISALAEGPGGTWVAGDAGLALVDGSTVRMMRGIDADTIGRITGLVATDGGDLWLNADRGVVWLPRAEIDLALDRPEHAARFRVFDYLDGVIGGAALIPPQSAVKTTDGRLWFVGFDNLVSIDPSAIRQNAVPPPVHIRAVMSGGARYPVNDSARLPVGATDLQVQYTALSLSMPERVRFRYRLEGADDAWHEAGTRREAFYTNLGPGSYRFQVVAANNDGVWNETGAAFSFVIPAAFHQSTWFRSLAVMGLAGAAWGLHRRRVHQLTRQMHARIEERLDERERIARELHDTLLQGVQGLILRFQAIATRLPAEDPAAQLMEEALTRADDVLVQGRDRVRGLRGINLPSDDLAPALARVSAELQRDTPAGFHLTTVGTPRLLHPVVRDEAYWIGREALINAFHHAQGEQVEVEVIYGVRDLRVRLRDNGRGIDPAVVTTGSRPEHWGLPGMRERAARIGAHLDVRSRSGAGTEVELRIPAAMAYLEPPEARRPWWRRLASKDRNAHA